MVAETLMLINPKRRSAGRKKPRSAAQKAATKRMVAANRSRRAPTRKSNPVTPLAANPRRRRRSALSALPARRRTRRHSNPINLKKPLAMLMPALMGAAGAIGVNVIMNYAPLPTMLTTGKMRHVTKLGLAVAIGLFGHKLLGSKAAQLAEGAMIVTLTDAIKDIGGGITGMQLGDSDGIAYISPAQLAAYTDSGAMDMGLYMNGADDIDAFDQNRSSSPLDYDYSYK